MALAKTSNSNAKLKSILAISDGPLVLGAIK